MTTILNKFLLRSLLELKNIPKTGFSPDTKKIHNVEVCPFKYGRGAAVCISADFELNWAWRFRDEDWMNERGKRGRENVPLILELVERFSIPITWATIGHLFLENCKRGGSGLAHPDMPRPQRFWKWEGDWYYHDPCSNYREMPLWYAPDLITKIMQSTVPQEIGTHSFSHIDFSSSGCSPELAEAEIAKCIEVMKEYSLRPRSFVFPFNSCTEAYSSIFSKMGLIAVRFRDNNINLSYPKRDENGIWKIYESKALMASKYYRMKDRVDIYIDVARKKNQVFHFWFHPSDNREMIMTDLLEIFKLLRMRADKSEIWLTTMNELAEYCELRRDISFSVTNLENQTKIVHNTTFCPSNINSVISFGVKVRRQDVVVMSGSDQNNMQPLRKENIYFKDNHEVIITVPVQEKITIINER